MSAERTSLPPRTAAEKLLDAAVEVFSREGISRATTREIAKVAGVNEVTLFRNFQNKQGLLAAVLERAFRESDAERGPRRTLEKGDSLKAVVMDFAKTDFARKRKNIALMRVLVGEVHSLGDHEAEVLRRIFLPWKEELAAEFRLAQQQGVMRPELNPTIIVDQLMAMVFIGALRVDMAHCAYPAEVYLTSCVETLLHGIAAGKEAV